MKRFLSAALGSSLLMYSSGLGVAEGEGRAVRPADELFWTPTLEQAIEMATANHVPIFVMGYSLVGERSTYTKFGEDCASTVF